MSLSGTARDLMTPLASFPHVHVDQTLRDVFAMLKEKYAAAEQFRSVLVLNRTGQPVGRITLHQLLRALLPDYLAAHPTHYEGASADLASLALLWQEDSDESCRRAAAQRVGDHMLPVAAPLAPDDPLTLALYRIAVADFNLVPVAEAGRVIGVVRIVDLLTEVANAVLDEGIAR